MLKNKAILKILLYKVKIKERIIYHFSLLNKVKSIKIRVFWIEIPIKASIPTLTSNNWLSYYLRVNVMLQGNPE